MVWAAFRWFGGPLVHPRGFQRDSFSWADEPEIDQNSSILRLDSPRKHCSFRMARSYWPQITCIIYIGKKVKNKEKLSAKCKPAKEKKNLCIKFIHNKWWEETNCTFSFLNAGKASSFTTIWKYRMLNEIDGETQKIRFQIILNVSYSFHLTSM